MQTKEEFFWTKLRKMNYATLRPKLVRLFNNDLNVQVREEG